MHANISEDDVRSNTQSEHKVLQRGNGLMSTCIVIL